MSVYRRISWRFASLSLLVFSSVVVAVWPKVQLEINPAVIDECDGGKREREIEVSWNADGVNADSVKLSFIRFSLSRALDHEVFWMEGEPEGRATTGPWGRDGFTVILRDGDGNELKRKTVETVSCEN